MKKAFLSHSAFSKSLPQMTEDMQSWASCVLKQTFHDARNLWTSRLAYDPIVPISDSSGGRAPTVSDKETSQVCRERPACAGGWASQHPKASSSMIATRVKVAVLKRENTKSNSDYVQNCRTHLRKLNR